MARSSTVIPVRDTASRSDRHPRTLRSRTAAWMHMQDRVIGWSRGPVPRRPCDGPNRRSGGRHAEQGRVPGGMQRRRSASTQRRSTTGGAGRCHPPRAGWWGTGPAGAGRQGASPRSRWRRRDGASVCRRRDRGCSVGGGPRSMPRPCPPHERRPEDGQHQQDRCQWTRDGRHDDAQETQRSHPREQRQEVAKPRASGREAGDPTTSVSSSTIDSTVPVIGPSWIHGWRTTWMSAQQGQM